MSDFEPDFPLGEGDASATQVGSSDRDISDDPAGTAGGTFAPAANPGSSGPVATG